MKKLFIFFALTFVFSLSHTMLQTPGSQVQDAQAYKEKMIKTLENSNMALSGLNSDFLNKLRDKHFIHFLIHKATSEDLKAKLREKLRQHS